MQQQQQQSCGRSLFQLAEENLTLHDEDKVRQTVQSSLSDTLLEACSDSPKKASFAEDSSSILESGSLTEKKKSVTLVGDAAVGSTGKKWSKSGGSSSKKTSSSKKKTILDDGSIQEPRTRISMFDDDDDIAETASQPISGDDASSSDHQPPVTEIVRKSSTHSKRSSSSSKTPPTTKQSAGGKPMKTPGGLVIPSPFTFSGRSIFPSTLGNCYPSTAADTSPPTTTMTAAVPAPAAAPARPPSRKTPSRQWPPPQLNSEEPVSSSSNDDGEERMEAEIEIQPHKNSSSPVPMFRISSSLEDLDTVHEASTSKETATMASARSKSDGDDNDVEDAAFLPNGVSSLDGETDQQRAGSGSSKKAATPKNGASTSSVASGDSTTGSEEDDGPRKAEFRTLKAKYERKISEQQDQAAMANRLARMRLDEIEKLEGQMDLMKDRQVDEQHQLREQLERTQREKKEEVERVRKVMEEQMQEKLEQTEAAAKATLEKELADAKRTLTAAAVTKQSKSSSPAPSHHKGQQSELQSVKRELAEVTAKLQAKEKETSRSKSPVKGGNTDTLYRVTKELAEVKEQLAAKEKELNEASTDKQKKTEAELARVEQELADVKEVLLESGKAATAAAASPTVSSETEDELKRVKAALSELTQKMVEKEKELEDSKKNMLPPPPSPGLDERESLQQQVALLDEQAAKSKQEHDRVLADLRVDSEKELTLVKQAMEHQSQEHKSKELELEEALSELRSRETREKEELLQQIKQLQAEKNTEHANEFQQNQELLERIAALEKKEKEILEDHQRSVDDLRAQGDSETQKLREQLEEARGVCKTHSTEKEVLRAEIEALESRIASESNGGVLADATLERLENDVKTAKKKHREELIALKEKSDSEIEDLKAKSDAEIKHLKEELEDRMALEEAMQIATNEGDAMKEEVQKLKIQLDEGKTLHLQNLADLRKQLADITAAHQKAVEKNGLLEQELKDHSAEAERHTERRCKEVREACDKEIEAVRKLHTEDESKFKALLAESTAKVDAIQTQCDKKIAQLETEIREKDEQFAQKLSEVEQHAEGDKKLQEEYEKLKTDHAKLERQMKEAESNHNNQYEELLSQLDLVEADHQEALTVKQKALSEKEAIVDALGSQLADSQKKMSATEQRLICQMEDTEHEQRKRKSLEKELESVNQEVVTLRETHKKFAKDAAREKQLACERAREEMIEKAESQFKQANEHYVKLRKQYDESQERAKKFEGELRIAKRKAEKLIKEKESAEIDLNAELAKLKAANAKIEADGALKTQEYRRELERLLQTAKDFESKAEKSERTSRNIQTTLATVVAEKEQLQKEYNEMKSVSEELMGIIESHQEGDRKNQHEF